MDFKILKRHTHFEGRVFDVQTVETRLPDGRERDYHLVVHPDAVTMVPVDEEGNIWFVRQFRVGAGRSLLELPAGVLEEDEDPLTGASREIREEIGMAAGAMRRIGGFFMSPGYSTEYMHVYLATDLSENPLTADDDEFLNVEAIPAARAYEMAASGEIEDGKTLVSLSLARPYLPEHLQPAS